MEVASINLQTKSGKSILLSVMVVPDIAVPLRNITNKEVTQLPHLKGLPLAHPVTTDESFRISLLIGVDHYWDITSLNISHVCVYLQYTTRYIILLKESYLHYYLHANTTHALSFVVRFGS